MIGRVAHRLGALAGGPAIWRLAAFAGVLAVMAVWEARAPRRLRAATRWRRWPGNLAVVAIGSGLIAAVFPISAVLFAAGVRMQGWGLLALMLGLPAWLRGLIGFVLLDLTIYLQHVFMHAAPVLWRLHRMHHTDLDFDTTTGVRFHPLELLLSMAVKFTAIAAIGPSPAVVFLFEVILNATSLFNHGNVRMPRGLDRLLRLAIVTPDMHRVHHSILPNETNSNYGFNFSFWDRLFGTYRPQPIASHTGMTIGIEQFRDPGELRLDRLLTQPFRGDLGRYPINRR
ncbi:MAG: sterol desaturase family protein [Gammaproteobacteria bacterium]|nr:sterol desaturase family protein [Gammaproteobacteria bacterium]